ncbi:cytidylate kinase family protein [Rickettsia hoogstraalii str. RCCE3]|nr:cytidylate kinase family protein [Rickettsia hoogstraalii str. RCCE3]
MEGRDIGTVVAPDADLKIFITANLKLGLKDDISSCKQKEKHVYSMRFYGK